MCDSLGIPLRSLPGASTRRSGGRCRRDPVRLFDPRQETSAVAGSRQAGLLAHKPAFKDV